MKYLYRHYKDLDKYLESNKALVIYGPRRVGKTTLLQNFLAQTNYKYKLDSGDDIHVQEVLSSQDFQRILAHVEGYELYVIDEAQNIPNIGMGLKILVDQAPGLKVIATGSSSFDLANQVGEPLVGRKWTLTLYPVAQAELLREKNKAELKRELEDYLVFGSYPEVLTANSKKKKRKILQGIINLYLYKDILALKKIKKSSKLVNLVKLLAFQINNEVSCHELGTQLGLNQRTVEKYLDLLEKTFVIHRVGAFSRNLRKEIVSKGKYYFWDVGIRNAVIEQFNGLENRNDVGALFENFVFMERLKFRAMQDIHANCYFWRTYDQKEIDLVEEGDGKLSGYEIKWGNKKVKAPKGWLETYDNASYQVINQENYLELITK